jgi:hypothetical protein
MKQGITFLEDFKLGHYMKIPPRAMFMAQVSSTYVPLPHITLAKGNCSSSCFFYSLSFLHTYMIFKFVNYTHLWSLLLFMRWYLFYPGGWYYNICVGTSRNCMVADGNHPKYMWSWIAFTRKPMDLPKRPFVLWCICDLGSYWPSQSFWRSWPLFSHQLVFLRRGNSSYPSLAGTQGLP